MTTVSRGKGERAKMYEPSLSRNFHKPVQELSGSIAEEGHLKQFCLLNLIYIYIILLSANYPCLICSLKYSYQAWEGRGKPRWNLQSFISFYFVPNPPVFTSLSLSNIDSMFKSIISFTFLSTPSILTSFYLFWSNSPSITWPWRKCIAWLSTNKRRKK